MFIAKNVLYLLITATIILIGNCSLLSSSQSADSTPSQGIGLREIIPFGKCSEPCLFGTSLENLTYNEVRELLLIHPLTKNASFTFEPDRITWIWAESSLPILLSDEFSELSYLYSWNYILFEQGKVSAVTISFAYSLEDVLKNLGDNFVIYPYLSTLRAGDSYILKFSGIDGWFQVQHRCNLSHFTPETLVGSYLYFSNYTPIYVNESIEPVEWIGYGTRIQGCSAFIPG